MSDQLAGQVAVITGGTAGIGRAAALQLAGEGAAVVLAGRNAWRGNAAARDVRVAGGRVCFVEADVRSETAVAALMERAVEAFGGIDLLFNNAGIECSPGPVGETESDCDDVLAVNVKGVFLCMKYALAEINRRNGGVIVNTGSFAGTAVPFPNAIMYGASKAAVVSMTRAAAVACEGANISVYAVCPYVTDTPMVDRLTAYDAVAKANLGVCNPGGRLASASDIASVVMTMFKGVGGYRSGDAVLVDAGGATRKLSP